MRSGCLLTFCLASACLAWSQSVEPDSADSLKQGKEAMRQGNWQAAEDAFAKVVAANPASVEAHTQLANALALQLSSGPLTSQADQALLARVAAEQRRATELAPQDAKVVGQLARVEDAKARSSPDADDRAKNGKLALEHASHAIELAPQNPDLRFELANMELFMANRAISEARGSAQGQARTVRIPDDAVRQSLSLEHGPSLDDSITQSEKVVELQPDNGFSMLQAAIGYGLRASLADTDAEAARYMAEAKQWEGRFRTQWGKNFSIDAERNGAGALLSSRVAIASDPRNLGGAMGAILAAALPLAQQSAPGNGPIRMDGKAAELNLLRKVQPVYPSTAKAARVQGTVEFWAVIGQGGKIKQLQLVRGHPLLVDAAREAVLQWEYKPMTLNGKPVAVVTDILINFGLSVNAPRSGTSAP